MTSDHVTCDVMLVSSVEYSYLPGQVSLLQNLLSSVFPRQFLPDMHVRWRVSVPCPHVTEQVQTDQDDQATKIR